MKTYIDSAILCAVRAECAGRCLQRSTRWGPCQPSTPLRRQRSSTLCARPAITTPCVGSLVARSGIVLQALGMPIIIVASGGYCGHMASACTEVVFLKKREKLTEELVQRAAMGKGMAAPVKHLVWALFFSSASA